MSRIAFAVLMVFVAAPALAQDLGTLEPKPLPALENPKDPKLAAKQLFGRKPTPYKAPTEVLGYYSKGCIAGAQELPINGPTWQVMRLSRNRNWGHPDLVAFLKRFSGKVPDVSEWKGVLVGDMSQPRGGPMLTGHLSHQVGLDADIWLTPMPDHEISRADREKMSATMVVAGNRLDVDKKVWSPSLLSVIKTAAQDDDVTRILVNPAIKKALCREATGDRTWLYKVRPFYGHDYHMHVRIGCPDGEKQCKDQDPPADNDGCGADLAKWFTPAIMHPKPADPPKKPKPPLTLADLPTACRAVVEAP
jgi:penicillin-insensitive murein endopeptidase